MFKPRVRNHSPGNNVRAARGRPRRDNNDFAHGSYPRNRVRKNIQLPDSHHITGDIQHTGAYLSVCDP